MINDEYVIIGGELYHYGIPGMRWGKRRAQAKKEYEADLAKKKQELLDEADKAYKKSNEHKWLKKNKGDLDDYYKSKESLKDDPNYDKYEELQDRAKMYNKDYAKTQSAGSGFVGALLLSQPAVVTAHLLTNGKIKNGKARAAILIGSAFGSIAVAKIAGHAIAKGQQKREIKNAGIKSVKERMRESKDKKNI